LDNEAVLRVAVSVVIAAKKRGDGIDSNILSPRYIGDSSNALKQK